MTIVLALRNRLHNMVYVCLAIIYFFISSEYIIECMRGYKTLGVTVGMVLLHIFIFASAWVARGLKYLNIEYWVIEIGYIVSYITCLIMDITDGAWLYIFPFGCVVLLFFDNLKAVVAGVASFSSIGVVSIFIDWNIMTELERIKVFQRCISLVICSIMVLIVSCSLNYVFKELHNWYKESSCDKITNLRSIYYFNEVLSHIIREKTYMKFSLAMIAVHEFYKYNEHDYTMGNSILKVVAERIKDELEKHHIEDAEICRQSGGRFFILFYNTDSKFSSEICLKIQSALHNCAVHVSDVEERFIDTNIVITDTDIRGHDYELMQNHLELMLRNVKLGSCEIDDGKGVKDDNSSDNK